MKKIEAKYQTIWGNYIRTLKEQGTPWYGYFELKQTDKDYLPFSAIEEHQLSGLQATARSGMYWKYSDQDMREKPCDCSCTPPLPSYIVIVFSGVFYAIDIRVIRRMVEVGEKKIMKEDADTFAFKVIHI